jgi:hypothetical protein
MRCAHFSFGALGADRSWELPRSLNSRQDRQAVRKAAGQLVTPFAWTRHLLDERESGVEADRASLRVVVIDLVCE